MASPKRHSLATPLCSQSIANLEIGHLGHAAVSLVVWVSSHATVASGLIQQMVGHYAEETSRTSSRAMIIHVAMTLIVLSFLGTSGKDAIPMIQIR